MLNKKISDKLNLLLSLEVLDNIKVKDAIIDCKKEGDYLVLTNQANEESKFFQQNLDVDEIKDSSVTRANDFTTKAINASIDSTSKDLNLKIKNVLEQLSNTDKDLKTTISTNIDTVRKEIINTKDSLYENISKMLSRDDANKKLKKLANKDEVVKLINNNSDKLSNIIKDYIELKIKELENSINDKVDNLPVVEDVDLEGESLVVVKNGKKKRKRLPNRSYAISGGGSGGGGGGSEDFKYTNTKPMPSKIGGLKKGTTFRAESLTNIFNLLLYAYKAPSFSSFIVDYINSYEVGSIINANPTNAYWNINDTYLLVENSIKIVYSNTGFIVAENVPNTGFLVFTSPVISFNTPTKVNFKISAIDTNEEVLESDFSFYFRHRVYSGNSELEVLTASDVKSLQVSSLVDKAEGTYIMGADGYKWICYPTYFGLKNSFKDSSSDIDIDMKSPIIVTVTNNYGITMDYYCHRTFNKLGEEIEIVVSL